MNTLDAGRFSTLGLLALLLMLTGCVTADARFSPDIQQSFREHDMRRMDTNELQIYYPAHRQEEALHIAARLEQCLDDLRSYLPRPTDWGRIPVFLPEVEFNNAYVAAGPGQKPSILLPTSFTANIFGDLGFTPSSSAVGCHEMVHYVQFIQVHGFFGLTTKIFGPAINPQTGFDSWFFEGLATYYESKLTEDVGRYGSPLWENYFAAGLQDGHLDGGRLNTGDREVAFGGHYLVGSYFIAYLADTYGEEKLWELVDRQGSSFFYPFGVSLRFNAVYGRSLGRLIDEFEVEMRQRFPARQGSPDQQGGRWVGNNADLETGPNGLSAISSSGLDKIRTIEIFDADSQRILRRRIPDMLPGREIVGFGLVESMRFSPDGESLYFLVYHLGRDVARTTLMRLDIERNRLHKVRDDVLGISGDITPDGSAYILASADGDSVVFQHIDLHGGDDRDLGTLPPGAYVGWVRVSPDGSRLSFTLMEDEEWSVAILDLESGDLIGKWTTGISHEPTFDSFWLDNERLLFSAATNGRVDVMEANITDGSVLRQSEVAYMAFNPRPTADGQGIQFLNRQGWGWTLDEMPTGLRQPTDSVYWEEGQIVGYDEPEMRANLIEDRPYSSLDGLFIPRLVVPGAFFSPGALWVSLQMMGRDELGFHNWAVRGQWDFTNQELSGLVGYVNTQLAPLYLGANVLDDRTRVFEEVDPENEGDDPTLILRQQRDLSAEVYAERSFFDIPLRLALRGGQFFREEFTDEAERDNTLVGAQVASQYITRRSTPYGGAEWLFGLSARASYYPEQVGSDFSLGDGRAQLQIHTPLPLSKRHRLRLSGRIRGLTGVPEDNNLMRIGGFSGSPVFSSSQPRDDISDRQLVPPGFSFNEGLRGYEDVSFAANQVAIVDLNYRYPIIIDRGATSVLMFFPQVFVKGFDLEAFASGATLMDGELHGAVGASTTALFNIWLIPLNIRYQFAQRIFDDLAQVHTVQLGVEAAF